MNIRERLLLALGILLGGSGLVFAFVPGAAPDFFVTSALIAAIAAIGMAIAGWYLVRLSRGEHTQIHLPTPEYRNSPTPGADFNRWVRQLPDRGTRRETAERDHQPLKSRVKKAANWVLAQEGHTQDERDEQLSTGSWTSDTAAAAFFQDSGSGTPSIANLLRSLWTGERTRIYRARHAIAALNSRYRRNSRADLSPVSGSEPERNSQIASVPRFPSRESGEPASEREIVSFPEEGETVDHRMSQWRGASVIGLAVATLGILLRQPSLLLMSVVGIGLAVYTRTASPPNVSLEVERSVDVTDPSPGDEVDVAVTVHNVGESICPDCTVIDGVPSRLTVADGSPRHGVALRPGNSTSFSYTLVAERGKHTFEPVYVITRDYSGSAERLTRISATSETTFECVPELKPLIRSAVRPYAREFGGRTRTNQTGSGLEFHTIREYQPGDPLNRVDWKRLAKTDELSSIQFRTERSPTVVLMIDARPKAFVASDPEDRSAVEHSIDTAGRIFRTLLDDNISVGIGALSPNDSRCWLAPDTGSAHLERARQLLAIHPVLTAPNDTGEGRLADRDSTSKEYQPGKWLHRLLPSDAQLIVLTPLRDDELDEWIQQVNMTRYPITIVSPDPSGADTPGDQLAHIERAMRIMELRSTGIPVLDWDPSTSEPLSAAMERLQIQQNAAVANHTSESNGAGP